MNSILDVRNLTDHPLSLLYSEIYRAVVVNGKVEHGRSQPGFSLTEQSPFVIAAKRAVEHGLEKDDVIDVIEEIFRIYYDNVQIKNAQEWIGLPENKDHILFNTPPWGAVLPWRARSLKSYQNAFEQAAIEENKSVGKTADISEGWLFCGPVSNGKRRIEAERMLYVLTQIKEKSYQRSNENDGDARATALINENNEWRWLLTGGNHRASAASALGYKEIPIRVNLVIKRAEVDFWPHVVNKLYTREEALNYFDSIFSANPPNFTDEWKKIIAQI